MQNSNAEVCSLPKAERRVHVHVIYPLGFALVICHDPLALVFELFPSSMDERAANPLIYGWCRR